jgi:multimeric flavodoxin WrbA
MIPKIVFVQGSPRPNGNTRVVAAAAMAAAREQGAEVVEIDAVRLEFKKPGCTGCQKCQQSESFVCTLGDQVAEVVATLPRYDVIVLATPIYWWSYTAQIKIFVDRMYSLSKFTEGGTIRTQLGGKTLALMATGGGPLEDNLKLLERQWKTPADMLGCAFAACLFPFTPPQAGVLQQDPAALQKAREFGRLLATAK